MNFELNKTYNGFKLIDEKNIKEINSIGRLFYHEKSGAKLFHVENDDDNKVFSISFRTPPKDSTGAAHILEHSVLCGSRKFPVKEPFVELVKGSLNTFLNAMTFSDKTMYPIASRNDKDFYNIIDVYLDAVFYPNIYTTPEIMMQEGWHYEIESKEDEINYKGVVYNEMKGAFSSPDSILMRKIQESLLPNTPYGVESGGDPEFIPDLTIEHFNEFHKKYYHPSNSYIYLYGNGDILEQLNFIDTNYLKDFDKIEVDSSIPFQKPFEEIRDIEVSYPIASGEKEDDKTYLSLNFAVSKSTEAGTYLAFDILEHLLLETPAAPLKKALIDAQIGKDVFGSYDSSILQPTFSIVVKGSNLSQKESFRKIVFDTLQKLVNEGIDKKLIEASINIKEFHLREADFGGYPKGLIYNIGCMDSWLYDASPMLHLQYNETFEKIKGALTTDYFEKLIDKYFLHNNHCSLLSLKPEKGLAEKKDKEVKEKLESYKASLSDAELEKLIEQTKKLTERQEHEDSPEALASIPMISLKDINPKADIPTTEEINEDGVKVLLHPVFTNNIAYTDFYFDTSSIPQGLLPYISLLSASLGKLSTAKYNYQDLSNEINIHTGGISYSPKSFSENGSVELFYPKLVVEGKSLTNKIPKLFEILSEVISKTDFNNHKRLKEIIQELRSRLEKKILERGHSVVVGRLYSYFSPIGYYDELLGGIFFYNFIRDLDNNFEAKADEIVSNLALTSKLIFNKNNLLASVTLDSASYNAFKDNLNIILDNLSAENIEKADYTFDLSAKNEGLLTSAKIQYNAKAGNFKKFGYSYSGSMNVLKLIMNYDYLWNKLRVQGGAYGAFNSFARNGNMYFASYRDPNLAESIDAYNKAYEYIKSFNASDREMAKYIIGTISGLDSPLTPSMKGELGDELYIRHIPDEEIQLERDEVLNTTPEAIQKLADLVRDTMNQNYICVLGGEEKVNENASLFKNLINVLE
ncbi:MAG: insulinase family protein [Bacillota bacterium]|nr:insulinase family protein [Bacillota bacterium]